MSVSDEWWSATTHFPDPEEIVEVYVLPIGGTYKLRFNNAFARAKNLQGSRRRVWIPYPGGRQLVGVTHWRYPQKPADI